MTSSRTARFAAAYAALTAAHEVGDFWVQTDRQATEKGRPGPAGAAACARHIATYTATQAAALYAVHRVTGTPWSWPKAAAALALSAGTHYVADRQGGHWSDPEPAGIVRLAHATGKRDWLLNGDSTAGFHLDQAWHKGWIAVAALIAA